MVVLVELETVFECHEVDEIGAVQRARQAVDVVRHCAAVSAATTTLLSRTRRSLAHLRAVLNVVHTRAALVPDKQMHLLYRTYSKLALCSMNTIFLMCSSLSCGTCIHALNASTSSDCSVSPSFCELAM